MLHGAFLVAGSAQDTVTLHFDGFSRSARYHNEIGVYKVQDTSGRVAGLLPTDAGYAAAALQASQVLFGSRTPGGAMRDLTFHGGDLLGFVMVQKQTIANALSNNAQNGAAGTPLTFFSFDGANPDHFEHVRDLTLPNGKTQLSWEDATNGGDQDFNDVIFRFGVAGANALRVPGNASQHTLAQFKLDGHSTGYTNEMGLFTVDAADGRIGNLRPGDARYAAAALADSRRQTLFTTSQNSGVQATHDFTGGSFFGVYLISNGTTASWRAENQDNAPVKKKPVAFFSFADANPDHFEHLQWNSATQFGWEDLAFGGDKDFNDLVATLTLVPASQAPPAAPTLDLANASDTGTKGDKRTDLATVTLTGHTDANTHVELVNSNQQTTSDAQGNFSFGAVVLQNGPNEFTVLATGAGGGTSESSVFITRNALPTVAAPVADVTIPVNSPNKVLDLSTIFGDVDIREPEVRMNTSQGQIDVQLSDQQAPLTVANFLNYVNSGRYNDSIIHRSVSNFVVQGGGFKFQNTDPKLVSVQADAPVLNEPGISNTAGTIAMAKLDNQPNSATNQWFFNLKDNSGQLNNQNGGFTVFGHVINSTMSTVDAIAAVPTQNHGGAFTNIPLENFNSADPFPASATRDNFVVIDQVIQTRRRDHLTFTATSSNTALAQVAVNNNTLTISYPANQTGTAVITVRATDLDGAFVEDAFTITVN